MQVFFALRVKKEGFFMFIGRVENLIEIIITICYDKVNYRLLFLLLGRAKNYMGG